MIRTAFASRRFACLVAICAGTMRWSILWNSIWQSLSHGLRGKRLAGNSVGQGYCWLFHGEHLDYLVEKRDTEEAEKVAMVSRRRIDGDRLGVKQAPDVLIT